MGLDGRDLFLVGPELALVGLAAAIVMLDLLVRRKGLVLTVALLGLLIPTAAGINLWNDVDQGGAEAAFHGALLVDKFSLYFKFLILGVLALVLLSGSEYMERFRPYQAEFIALLMFSAAGLMLLPAAGDLVTLYVSLELASLPIVALVAFLKAQVTSTEAGIKYLLLSAVSSALLLYGFAFLYAATGTVRIVSLDGAEPTVARMLVGGDGSAPFGSVAVLVGAVLATAGLGFKLSMVPFHM